MSLFSRWLKNALPVVGRPVGRKAGKPGSRLVLEALEDRLVMTASLQVQGLPPGDIVNSYAGVGLKQNEVGILYAQVNGQADPNASDFQAQINWGDGSSSAGSLVYIGNNGNSAEFLIKGSHTYAAPNGNATISVSVSGEGTSASSPTAQAIITAMPSGFPGTAPQSFTPTIAPANVQVQVQALPPGDDVNSYAGVGLQQNEVGILYAQVNGQADPNVKDFHAQINWGDSSAWTAADLVYIGNNGNSAEFLIKGSHTYAQPNSNIPVVVYVNGPDGTSASNETAVANAAPMPSGIPGAAPAATPITLPPSNVQEQIISLPPGDDVNFNAGDTSVRQLGTLQAQVNGEGDPNVNDFHVQINWGSSSAWTAGSLVYTGMSGNMAQFAIEGSPPANLPAGTNVPIVAYVTGPDGTSTSNLTAYANVTAQPTLNLGPLSVTKWTDGKVGYKGTISVSGGSGKYHGLEVTGLPSGLKASLSGHTITITGTPTQSGTFNLEVSLEDSNGEPGSTEATLTINARHRV
jgi:hypothetical protein